MDPRIILIDDSEDDRYLFKRVVRSAGLERDILEFPDGEPAWEFFRDLESFERDAGPHPPASLVFLDINMPRMGGFDLLERLQEHADRLRSRTFFVVMFTSSRNTQDQERALAYDIVRDYVVKPLDTEQLGAIIARHYQGGRTGTEG
ncbi:MAG: response regulator [Candidatus Eisenbacteria bacterium]